VRTFFDGAKHVNVGIVMGGLAVVLDVDGDKGRNSLKRLEDEYGALPDSWAVSTSRGRHLYFATPDVKLNCNSGHLGDGLDLRARGYYVVGPGSIHISGAQYSWVRQPDDAPLAPMPLWLVKLAATPAAKSGAPTDVSIWRDIAAHGVAEGQRNNAIARFSGHLLRRKVDPHVVLHLMTALNAARFRPPLPDIEIRTIVGSICAKELERREAAGG
jgi:hypothetical protein